MLAARRSRFPPPPAPGPRVELRPWRRSDAPALAAILDDAESARWTAVSRPYTVEDAARWLARRPGRDRMQLAVVDRTEGTVAGAAELAVRSWRHALGEVSYVVGPAHRGRGLAAAAVEALARWAFDDVGLERLELYTQPGNTASQRVALKSGFEREGLIRSARRFGDGRVDLVLYSRLR